MCKLQKKIIEYMAVIYQLMSTISYWYHYHIYTNYISPAGSTV